VTHPGHAPRDARRRHATRKSRVRSSGRPSQCVPTTPSRRSGFSLLIATLAQKQEALHAQISETLRGILSDDEFAAEAPG